jgi:hypothetical protein
MLDALGELNEITYEKIADPETRGRIAQYEMAFRMQSSRARSDRYFEGVGHHLPDVR